MALASFSRYFRFSLRTLLLLITLIAVAITVYRWPWEESREGERWDPVSGKSLYQELETTTYRRDWRGQPMLHGPKRVWRNGELRYLATYYEGELHGLRQFFDPQGNLLIEGHYRRGKLHGPYRAGDGNTWIWQGEYADDMPHGQWRILTGINDRLRSNPRAFGPVFLEDGRTIRDDQPFHLPGPHGVLAAHWDHGAWHGKWTWTAPDGEILHTAEYHQGNLVRWNGEPVVEQFLAWLRGPEMNDARLANFFETARDVTSYRVDGTREHSRISFMIGNDQAELHVRNLPNVDWDYVSSSQLSACICEQALVNGYRFENHYGQLWLVPAEDFEEFVDRTGVAQVAFEPESEQEREWNAPVDVMPITPSIRYVNVCAAIGVRQLLAGTKFEIDDSALSTTPVEVNNGGNKYFTRRRCDALGLLLFETGCRVEQRGNKLIFTPRPDQTEHERNTNPFPVLPIDPFG